MAQTVDPLGGSYFVEKLTLDMEKGAFDYFDKLDAMGGMVKAIENGLSAERNCGSQLPVPARGRSARRKSSVGVNDFVVEEAVATTFSTSMKSVAQAQTGKLKTLRARRSNEEVSGGLWML